MNKQTQPIIAHYNKIKAKTNLQLKYQVANKQLKN